MTENSLDHRFARLRFRSWRRGFRELDLILGPWADQNITTLSEEELRAYEALLDAPDWDVFYCITQNRVPTFSHSVPLMRKLSEFSENNSR